MKTVTLNFRDAKTEPAPDTDERVFVVFICPYMGTIDVMEKDAEDVHRDEFWIPASELESALYGEDTADEG